MTICDICKEEGTGNDEDYGQVCDSCLKEIKVKDEQIPILRLENENLRDELAKANTRIETLKRIVSKEVLKVIKG